MIYASILAVCGLHIVLGRICLGFACFKLPVELHFLSFGVSTGSQSEQIVVFLYFCHHDVFDKEAAE